MKKLLILFTIFCLITTFVTAQRKRKNRGHRNIMNYRVLKESNHCGVDNPFIFIARDQKTFANFPINLSEKIDFSREAVVGFFAGTKPTMGYRVQVSAVDGIVSGNVQAPPSDAIVAEVLTSPCKIVAVAVPEDRPLLIKASSDWKMSEYKITKGKIEYSGGFAPRQKSYDVEGKIFSLASGNLITLIFELNAKGDSKIKLHEAVSGVLENGLVNLNRVDPGGFSENPRPFMKATGTLSAEKLSLKFEPNPTVIINDGFQAEGFVEAIRIKSTSR